MLNGLRVPCLDRSLLAGWLRPCDEQGHLVRSKTLLLLLLDLFVSCSL